jgi:hypothetical protein
VTENHARSLRLALQDPRAASLPGVRETLAESPAGLRADARAA